ncbi:hypothetical protein ACIHFD_58985 [Nonomuraea sp. NPDC051941]|uniref:hypothetical protein n=1 Tax=Nonomuraea sp. NPDC051941 TaxID=3364373 RepID=UPI0037CA0C87
MTTRFAADRGTPVINVRDGARRCDHMVLFAGAPVTTVLLAALVLACPMTMRSMGGEQAGRQRHQTLERDPMPEDGQARNVKGTDAS